MAIVKNRILDWVLVFILVRRPLTLRTAMHVAMVTALAPSFAAAQTLNLFSPSMTIQDLATAPTDKPELILNQNTAWPKARVAFQRSQSDSLWSALTFSINADWNSTSGIGYVKDVPTRSQTFLQMEYEYDAGGGLKANEINWTTNGRRIFNLVGKSEGFPDLAGLTFLAPLIVSVPQFDASSYGQPDPTGQWDPSHNHGIGGNALPALLLESYQGAGSASQLIIQNNNHDSQAAAAQIYLRGVGSAGYPSALATSWAIGIDRYWGGVNNFYIYDAKRGTEAFFIDQTGNVGIGTSQPAKTLDVNGSITIGHGAATWTQGSAAPTANEPDGSLYSRVNAGTNSGLYVRQNGVWIKK